MRGERGEEEEEGEKEVERCGCNGRGRGRELKVCVREGGRGEGREVCMYVWRGRKGGSSAHLSEADCSRAWRASNAREVLSSGGAPNPASSDMRLSRSMLRNTKSSWKMSQGRVGVARDSTSVVDDSSASSRTLSDLRW